MWGKQATFENKQIKLFKPENSEEGCAEYAKPDAGSDSFAMLVTGLNKCPFGNLIHNAQKVKASALFISYYKTGDISGIVLPNLASGKIIMIRCYYSSVPC